MSVLAALLAFLGLAIFVIFFLAWILLKIPWLKKRFGERTTTVRNIMLAGLVAFVTSMFFTGTEGSQAKLESSSLVSTSQENSITASTASTIEEPVELANITITSDPEGAELTVNGSRKGDTPATFQAPINSTINYRLVVKDDIAEYDLYKEFEGTLEITDDEAISVWIERTTADEQTTQKSMFEERQRKALYDKNKELLEDAEVSVKRVCENLVKDVLKAPSTAKFPGLFSGGWDYRFNPETGKAVFISYVDAQNGFGAMIRSDFGCSYDVATDTVSLDAFE